MNVRVFDVNPGISEADIVKFIQEVEVSCKGSTKKTVVFFDEINTSIGKSILLK